MDLIWWILAFSFLGSIAGMIGGAFLLWKERLARKITIYLVGFAAGALLGTAFLDLLPEAIGLGSPADAVFLYTFMGMISFYIMERFLLWRHCHRTECDVHSFRYMVLIGDAVHNFIDGIIIAATFIASIPLGILTSVAVFFHEVPQEIGDFGVLMHSGMKRGRILLFNFLTAATTFAGALFTFFFLSAMEGMVLFLLPFAAGGFIYIAAADLIPETHKHMKSSRIVPVTAMFFLGVAMIWAVTFLVSSQWA